MAAAATAATLITVRRSTEQNGRRKARELVHRIKTHFYARKRSNIAKSIKRETDVEMSV
jgi:hypothetical protein